MKRAGGALAGLTPLLGWALACAPLPPPPPARPAGARSAAVSDELLARVPASAQAVLTVDVALLRRSAWARPVLDWAAQREGGGSGAKGVRDRRGFDEVEDADRWLFARVGDAGALSQPEAATKAATLELSRGRFDATRVLSSFAATRPQARATDFLGSRGMSDGEQAVALLDRNTLAFGAAPVLEAAVRAGRGGADSAAAAPWLAAVFTALDDEAGARSRSLAVELALRLDDQTRRELGELLEGEAELRELGARLFLGRTARVFLVGLTPGRDQARALAAALAPRLHALADRRSVRALALSPALRRAVVTARGSRVVFELQMSDSERELVAEKLAALAELLAKSPETPPPP
jgi:hypothetical protein